MLWLKRNLDLAIALLLGLLLAGLGGYYVWTKKSLNSQLDEELESTKIELERLMGSKPTPNAENLSAARKDLLDAQKYSDDCRKLFQPTLTEPLNSQTYKSLLETTTAALRKQALQAGVEIPTNYNFSFEAQRGPVRFEPATLKPLAEQLAEIRTLCEVLFKARVHRLESIRRIGVSEHDIAGSSELLPNAAFQPSKTTGMTAWPYEFTIETFSADLGRALSELSAVERGAILKILSLQPSSATPMGLIAGVGDPAVQSVPQTVIPRQPPRGRTRPGAPVTAAAAAGNTNELKTALEERLVRAVFTIHIVKPEAAPPGRRPSP